MTTVLAFGTFDLLHPGHLSYLKQAKKLGDRLVVIVATDANVKRIKGKKPVNDQKHRKELVAELKIVDEVFVGFEDDMIKSVEKVNPDIVALGYDQNPSDEKIRKIFEERGIKARIVRMKPYKENEYKSSKIKERAKKHV
ncbi:MAG TPA: adenylyltransferase/cytidyltransferase family protein [archaeon]|nr:adenylyltransferase/cytidyltransferase family protein [archaeon]